MLVLIIRQDRLHIISVHALCCRCVDEESSDQQHDGLFGYLFI
jgi:hypothetical protein